MKKVKLPTRRRVLAVAIIILCGYILQGSIFPYLAFANIKPNILIIITASFGFMRGSKDGMFVGFFAGILLDIQFGEILGFYAILYLVLGYLNGLFEQVYYKNEIRLPLFLIGGSSITLGLLIYFLRFVLRGEFNLFFYLQNIILPELIYTVVISLVLYRIILRVNERLEAEEKRSAGNLV